MSPLFCFSFMTLQYRSFFAQSVFPDTKFYKSLLDVLWECVKITLKSIYLKYIKKNNNSKILNILLLLNFLLIARWDWSNLNC